MWRFPLFTAETATNGLPLAPIILYGLCCVLFSQVAPAQAPEDSVNSCFHHDVDK